MDYSGDIANSNDVSKIIEQLLIALAKYIANDDQELEAKIHRDITLIIRIDVEELGAIRADTLIVTTLIEFLYTVKYAVCILDSGF